MVSLSLSRSLEEEGGGLVRTLYGPRTDHVQGRKMCVEVVSALIILLVPFSPELWPRLAELIDIDKVGVFASGEFFFLPLFFLFPLPVFHCVTPCQYLFCRAESSQWPDGYYCSSRSSSRYRMMKELRITPSHTGQVLPYHFNGS